MTSQSSSNYSRISGNVGFDAGAGTDGSVSGRSIYKPISQSRGSFKDYQKKVAVAGGGGTSGNAGQMSIHQNTGLAFLAASSGSVHSGVDSVKKGRAQEKKDLQELNERFASYIEKARFLEAQNKSLVAEIEFLKGGSTSDNSKIKEMYEIELNQLRKLLNEAEKAKGPLELKIHSLETELDDFLIRMKVLENSNSEYKLTIDKQRKEILGLESELVQLRRFRSTNEEDSSRYKDEISYIKDDLKRVKQDFEREALARINLEHDLQSLQETLEFERQVNETELKNLSGVAYRDTTKENQVFWQNEMGRALRDIQGEYENKLVAMKQEIEANYGLQLQEIRTSKTRENVETTHLREENVRTKSNLQNMKTRMSELEMKVSEYEFMINQLRGDLEESQRASELQRLMLQEELTTTKSNLIQTLAELQSILDAKLGLELEICAYRKLLEFEETRLNTTEDIDPVVSQFVNLTVDGGSYGGGGAAVSNRSGISTGGGVLNGGVSSASISLGGGVTTGGGASVSGKLSIEGGLNHGRDSNETESQKIKFRRTTKGNISIAEIDIEGTSVILENIGSSVEHLDGMMITRTIDGSENAITYTIPANISLKANQKLNICAYGTKTGKGKELEIDDESWGVGEDIKTTLFDAEGERLSKSMFTNYLITITVFLPDDHLFQVEFHGEDCVILGVEKKSMAKLQDELTVKKIALIGDHIGLAFTGLTGDARVLINRAYTECKSYKLTSEDASLVEYIAGLSEVGYEPTPLFRDQIHTYF